MAHTLRERWLRRPQNIWLRRALFQVHLWSGIILGLYVVVVCVSGSAIVFRTDLENFFSQRSRIDQVGLPLSRGELKQVAETLYPHDEVRVVSPGRFPSDAAEAWLVHEGSETRRLFDPYAPRDLGPSPATYYHILRWMGDLHGNLLLGPHGLFINGIGGVLITVLCLTGLVVWWPGIATWRRGLGIRRNVGWKRFNWDLHSASGFWLSGILLVWSVTAAYFIFPEPFRAVINVFTTIDPPRRPVVVSSSKAGVSGPSSGVVTRRRVPRPRTRGQNILRGFSSAHYGNFGGWPLKALYVLLGIAPAILFVTGMLMWWNRVLGPALRRLLRISSSKAPKADGERDEMLEAVSGNLAGSQAFSELE